MEFHIFSKFELGFVGVVVVVVVVVAGVAIVV
jgi:hypothetical protein